MSEKTKNILIVDDHRLVADGLALILSRAMPEASISTSNNVRSVLEDQQTLEQQNLILADLNMPNLDGFAFLSALKKRGIKVPVIIVSAQENKVDIERVLKDGAQGFIPKNAPSIEFITGIKAVEDGKVYVPEHLTGEIDWAKTNQSSNGISNDDAYTSIRPRQIEVLKLIKAGYSNTDIGVVLSISESTVKTHVTTLFKALNVKNRTACVQEGLRLGLID